MLPVKPAQTLLITQPIVFQPPEGPEVIRVALEDEAELPDVADAALRCGARVYALIPHQRTLEDLFVESVKTRDA